MGSCSKNPIITFPLHLTDEVVLHKEPTTKGSNSTCNSFFMKHKMKQCGEVLGECQQENPESRRLAEALEISKNLYSRILEEYQMS